MLLVKRLVLVSKNTLTPGFFRRLVLVVSSLTDEGPFLVPESPGGLRSSNLLDGESSEGESTQRMRMD